MRLSPVVLFATLLPLAALATPPGGLCEVKVSGGAEFSFEGKGGRNAVASDHWYNEQELRRIAETSARALIRDETKRQAAVDKAMKDGGRQMGPLLLSCISSLGGNVGTLNFLPSDKNTRKTVPFKPATYKLVSRTPKAKEFSVLLRADDVMYAISGPGKLVIERFDAGGISGTFSFPAKTNALASKPGTKAHSVTVTGTFDFACSAATEMCANAPR
jgi:hypothetical protein